MSQPAYERPAEVLVRDLGDELVLLNTRSEQYHSLNDVGRRCYELLCDGRDVGAAADEIAAEYGVETRTVAGDLAELVPQLLAAGLLTEAS